MEMREMGERASETDGSSGPHKLENGMNQILSVHQNLLTRQKESTQIHKFVLKFKYGNEIIGGIIRVCTGSKVVSSSIRS
jgi:hypothetical protein